MTARELTEEQRSEILDQAIAAALKSVGGTVENTESTRALIRYKKKLQYVIDVAEDGRVNMAPPKEKPTAKGLAKGVTADITRDFLTLGLSKGGLEKKKKLAQRLHKVQKKFNKRFKT